MTSVYDRFFNLKGKTAIVTGGASGLGEEYSRVLLAAGARLLVVSRSKKGWTELKKFAEENHGQADFFQKDLTDENAGKAIVEKAAASFSKIDILINNAGVQIRNRLADFQDSDWKKSDRY
ncbi:hypothetical protein Q757_03665 [Oenococcus alcoholitolerans]|uniref:Gluconate 5-dehydrogenase n=1 Tax=Oenococcus alcoholitolerans TaxID=931074 RepID=A0ABR4XRB1_9LACO|nr:hypothetical protein Q757_03665 [Oenococcus alcoholitolerans]